MKLINRLLILAVVIAVFAIPAAAQETGSGAPIIEPNFGDDIATLNPITNQDGPSDDIIELIYPELLEPDPATASWIPGADDSLALDWSISEDGRTYTFMLRDDWVWSDGTPVTSADLLYHWTAIEGGAPTANTSLRDNVESMSAPDDYTLVITYREADCTALDTLNDFFAVPAHVWTDVFGDDYENMDDNDYNLNPTVTGAEFVFRNFRPGEQVTLLANPDFPNGASASGNVVPEGFIDKIVTDQVVQMEQFYAGELTWINSVPQAAQEEAREKAAAGEVQYYEAPSATIRFLAFNLADPSNPVAGLDEEGNALEQGNHPILGDKRVRQALRFGYDFDEINEGVFFGSGVPAEQSALPTSWAFNPDLLDVYSYNPERAMELLDEAGFTDQDGDGVRECHGCMYAEEGAPLSFVLQTNAGNTSQEALYTILQDKWAEIGFEVEVEFNDFNAIVDALTGQTYDAVGLFWGYSVPDNPNDMSDMFMPSADVPGAGFNVSSFNNERVNELLAGARVLPGCNLDERAEMYREVQTILNDELPWLFIGAAIVPSIAQPDLENWDPLPGNSRHNIDAWDRPS